MRSVGSLLAVAVCVAAAACSHEGTQTASRTPAQVENAALGCPLAQPVHVETAVMDVPGGVAITFTGTTKSVDLIRANVHAMQDANDSQGNPFAVCPCATSTRLQYGMLSPEPMDRVDDASRPSGYEPYASADGTTYAPRTGIRNGNGAEGRTLMQGAAMPAADARVDDIPTGAMLVLQPKDAADLPALREQVHANARAMETGCKAH